eukprot:1161298-Pelagomonas_calceolata.AAC.4
MKVWCTNTFQTFLTLHFEHTAAQLSDRGSEHTAALTKLHAANGMHMDTAADNGEAWPSPARYLVKMFHAPNGLHMDTAADNGEAWPSSARYLIKMFAPRDQPQANKVERG